MRNKPANGSRHTIASVTTDAEEMFHMALDAFEAIMGRKATEEEIAELLAELIEADEPENEIPATQAGADQIDPRVSTDLTDKPGSND